MITEIKIKIDTYTNPETQEKYCANCHLQRYSEINRCFYCNAFNDLLKKDINGGSYRLEKCLEAEVKE